MADPVLARPANPIGVGLLPPCNEPAPYDRDDRLIWVLRCNLEKQLGAGTEKRLVAIVTTINVWSLMERAEVSAGVGAGLVSGSGDAVRDGLQDLAQLVISAAKIIASGYGAAFDPAMWQGIELVLTSDPGPKTQEAIKSLVDLAGKDHPEFIEALMTAGMVCATFRKIVQWVKAEPNAPYIVLLAVAAHIGTLLGEIAADLDAASTPFDFGKVIGVLLGQLFVAVARFYFGV